MKRLLKVIFLFSALGALGFVFWWCNPEEDIASFVLINRSNENIIAGSVSLSRSDRTVKFSGIGVDGTISSSFIVKGDSSYHVDIQLESGKKIEREIGYLTNGFHSNDELIVTSDDISIQSIELTLSEGY